MGKPIKEWGVVKFLSKKLPNKAGDIIGNTAEVLTGQKTIFQAVGDVISGSEKDLTPEEIAQAYKLAEQDHEEYMAELADRQDARAMQVQNLKHGDRFTRRFVYWYAGAMTFLIFVILGLLFFVEIPSDNKRIIDMIIGVISGTGLAGIFQYFFGSSQGSKNKEGILASFMQNKQ